MADLTALSYASLDPLATRIRTHQHYSEHPDDLESAVDEALELGAADGLLDIGCGTGAFLRRLAGRGHTGRLVGIDRSPAAVSALSGMNRVYGDAQALPFADGSFHAITARHMLYHVPDPYLALAEVHRVLRASGRFVAVVNIENTTPLLMEVLAVSLAGHGLERSAGRDSIHSGNLPGMVEEVFGDVTVDRHDNAFVFGDPEPVIAYVVSCLPGAGIAADDPRRDEIVATVSSYTERLFERHGPQRDPKGYVVVSAVRR